MGRNGIIIAVIFAVFRVAYGEEVLVDRIVAIYNSTPILYSEIKQKLDRAQPVVVSAFPATKSDSISVQATQDEINYRLIVGELEKLDVSVNDDEVSKQIEVFLKQRSLSLSGLKEALFNQGITYENYFEDFRKRMFISRFQGRVLRSRVKVTDKDIHAFYQQKISDSKRGGSQIDAVVSLSKIKCNSKEKAQQVLKKIRGGQEFSDAAKLYSDAEDAMETSGKMMDFKMSALSESLLSIVKDLEQGEVSEIAAFPDGFYIFRLDEKKLTDKGAFEKEKANLERELLAIESEKQLKIWLESKRAKATIKIIN